MIWAVAIPLFIAFFSFSASALLLAVVALFAQLSLLALNLLASRAVGSPARHVACDTAPSDIVFSVHVPIHNEPPDLVIGTLAALEAQIGDIEFEVIVVDNNTSDSAVWKPVSIWCEGRPRFRFLHRLGVVGAKAGALNLALEFSSPHASHVIVVDADYQVEPRFLSIVKGELATTDSEYLQFPQAYRHADVAAPGVALELADYFNRHATAASGAGVMLLTGTLCVIDAGALRTVGGWSGRTSTEDAELGLRLTHAGYRGRFVDRVVGRGLMPLSLGALHRQRHRWAAGNVRTAIYGVRDWWRRPERIGWRQVALAASQLTAWTNFAAPAAVALVTAQLQVALGSGQEHAALTIDVAVAALLMAIATAVVPLCQAGRGAGTSPLATAAATRLAMLPTSAVATVAGLLPHGQGFAVTPKVSPARRTSFFADVPPAMTGALCVGVVEVAIAWAVPGTSPTLGLLFASPFLAAQISRVALRRYAVRVARPEV